MRTTLGVIAAVLMITVSIAAASMPASFYTAMDDMKTESLLCVKNYQAGTAITENYYDFNHLDKETKIVSRTNRPSDTPKISPSMEASINSNVEGKARIGWISADPSRSNAMHRLNYARNIEELVGVFSVEMFIRLWRNSTPGEISLDWMPCV
jgi:hypothetical protein